MNNDVKVKEITKIEINNIYNMDCIEGMEKMIQQGIKIDLILCDLPYGTTAHKWDSIIPFNDYIVVGKNKYSCDEFLLYSFKKGKDYNTAIKEFVKNKQNGLWTCYKSLIKDDGVIVLFATQPFTSKLICSSLDLYRYSWIWKKNKPTGHLNSKYAPLKATEDICIFSKSKVGSLSKK